MHDSISLLSEERLGGTVQVVGDGFGLLGGFGEVNGDDLAAPERHHLAPLAVLDGFGGAQTVAGREDAVVGGGGAAALQVPEDDVAGVYSGALLQFAGQALADAAEAHVAELVLLAGLGHEVLAERYAFGDGDDAPAVALLGALLEEVGYGVEVRFHFRDQRHVRGGGDACAPRDPTGVAAHDLHDQYPLVALSRGPEAVYRLRRYRHGGIVPEGRVGRREVVVYGLGAAYDLRPEVFVQPLGYAQRVVAADGDEGVHAE